MVRPQYGQVNEGCGVGASGEGTGLEDVGENFAVGETPVLCAWDEDFSGLQFAGRDS
jgi:hypothetical protein